MTRSKRLSIFSAMWLGVVLCLLLQVRAAGPQAKMATPPQNTAAPAAPKSGEFYLHSVHAKDLGLDCSTCHLPAKEGSVALQRPGHDQCMACHAEAFGDQLNKKICAQCHSAFPPTSSEDLIPFPKFKGTRPLLTGFSHAKHVDPKARIDAHNGFRSDCTFCHKFDAQGVKGMIPGHVECASCHSKTGMKPLLSAASTTADCRSCHAPEQIENPVATAKMPVLKTVSFTGEGPVKYDNIKFSHASHFKHRESNGMTCETCHAGAAKSTGLSDFPLPTMAVCAQCHGVQKTMPAQFRMQNCQACHVGKYEGSPSERVYSSLVKPVSHTENFRQHHQADASAKGATCYACHTNVAAKIVASSSNSQCMSCHQVMRPASHTARWRDDVHGKYASLDRETCATCHATDFCSRCHNEMPRSHVPIALFKGGAHARLAMLNERSCLTCHTFQNTCAECHTKQLK
jgi:hypothetical protein